jgi:hypothetical protein
MRLYVALAILITSAVSSRSVEGADYKYPYHNPYLATATTAILNDDGATARVKSTILRIPGLPGRNNLPTLQGRGHVSLALYRHKQPAPLVFVLGGIGSNPFFGVAPYLASLFYREGFHVVALPSPMSWNFALSASRSGAPGYAPEDARDLYEVMQKTLMTLRDRYRLEPTSIHFMGVSRGALQGAHLSQIDTDEGKIGIARYLLVNPPVDLAYAVGKIDEWNSLAGKFGGEKSRDIISRALTVIDRFSDERRDDPEVFDRLAKKLAGFTTEELQFLIAETLQSQLPEVVYVSQVIHDRNVLTAPKDNMRKRLEEAGGFTFTDYNQRIAVPLWRKETGNARADLERYIQQGSLAAIIERLRRNPKVHILHNADDFLAERRSIKALKEALGDQVKLYPRGGHLGNLWFPKNKDFALEFFRPRP